MNSEKVLKYTIYTALAALLFVPLIVTDSMYFPFITGKNFTFRFLTEIIVAAWVVLAIWYPAYRPKFSWILGAFGTLTGVMLLAALTGANPYDSIWSNFERMEGWVTLLHLFGLFVAISSTLRTKKAFKKLFRGSVIAAVVVGLFGVAQLLGWYEIHLGGNRLDATLGNASYLAIYMVLHIFLALWLLWERAKDYITRSDNFLLTDYRIWLYIGAIVLFLLNLFYTGTRGAMLGLLGGLGIAGALVALFGREYPRVRKVAIGGVLAVVLVVGGFFAIKNTQFAQEAPVLSRFADVDFDSRTVRSRFMIWDMALQGVADRPILGWGQGNFNYIFNTYYNPQMYDQEQWFDRAHNVVLDWLTGGGVVGVFVYLSLFVFGLYYLWERHKKTRGWLGRMKQKVASVVAYVRGEETGELDVVSAAIFTGLLAAYFGHNLFVFDNVTSYIIFVFVLAFIHALYARKWELFEPRSDRPEDSWTQYGVPATAGVLLIGAIYLFNWNGFMQARTLIDALRLSGSGQLGGAYVTFQEALAYDSYGTQEVREQIAQTTIQIIGNDRVPEDARNQFFNLAETELKELAQEDPLNVRAPFFLGSLYDRAGDYGKAVTQYERARELSPGKQQILLDLGVTYLRMQEFDTALEVIRTAYEGAPRYLDARKLYITAAIYAEEFELAHQLSSEITATMGRDATKVAEVSAKRRQRIAQAHIAFAAVYARVEEFQRAIEEVRLAIDILPEFREQGEQFIEQLRQGRVPDTVSTPPSPEN